MRVPGHPWILISRTNLHTNTHTQLNTNTVMNSAANSKKQQSIWEFAARYTVFQITSWTSVVYVFCFYTCISQKRFSVGIFLDPGKTPLTHSV